MKKANHNFILGIMISLAGAQAVYANPNGAQVVNGQVNIAYPDPNTMAITNSNGAIINWQQFSIQKNEITRFIQSGSASAILNRVTGRDPSSILGQLLSNGRVFLINPNGIVFGPNSIIDTAGLVASTLDMTDEDFINQNLKFEGDNAADISNKGYIKAGVNGDVFLIAPNIENSGIIDTDGGEIILAAGESVTIASLDSDHIVFDVQAPENEVMNLGELITNGGAAKMFAGSIKHQGSINANSLSVDENGNVQLVAKADIEITSDATITANGSNGGDVKLESESGTVWNSGSIEAKGTYMDVGGRATQDAKVEGKGGHIEVLGERVAILGAAHIDASGETGGGEILVGGDYQGKNDDVKNAKQTYIGKDTSIKADAVINGDGGKVIVWADESTQFYGEISAKGGSESGDGGFVETSGKDYLEVLGIVNASAINGNGGEWLLDPNDIDLQSVGSNAPTDDSSNGTWNFVSPGTAPPDPNVFSGGAGAGIADIDTIIYTLGLGTDVTITTSTGSGGTGNITVTDAMTLTLNSNDVLFTLDADNNIIINNSITASGANTLTLGLDAPGTITINGDIDTNGGLIDAQSMGAGNVLFNGTRSIDSDFNATTLTLDSTDDVSFNGITNTATLIHSSGTLNGTGDVNVSTTWTPTSGVTVDGNLVFNGSKTFNGFTFNGSGSITLGGGLSHSSGTFTTNPAFNVGSNFSLTGGTITGTGNITITGATNWNTNSITISGNSTLFANGGFNIGTLGVDDDITLTDRTLEIGGSSTWDDVNGFSNNIFGNGSIINKGDITANNNGTIVIFTNFTNASGATFTKNQDAGDIRFIGGFFNNDGTVTVNTDILRIGSGGTHTGDFVVNSPGTLRFDAGTANLTAGTVRGGGVFQVNGATVNINNTTDFDLSLDSGGSPVTGTTRTTSGSLNINVAGKTGALQLQGGTLGGTQDFTVSGSTTFSSTTTNISGSGTLFANGGFNIGALGVDDDINLNGRTIEISGTSTWDDVNGFTNNIFGTGSIVNKGDITANNNGEIDVFVNFTNDVGATFTKNLDTGLIRFLSGNFTNDGTITVNTNTVRINNSGTHTHTGDFIVNSPGTLLFDAGTHNLNGSGSVSGTGTLQLSGAALNINNTSTINTFVHSSGTLGGSGSLTVNNTWTPTRLTPLTINGNLILGSSVSNDIDGGLDIDGGGTITNQGMMIFRKNTNATNATIDTDLVNEGTIRLRIGDFGTGGAAVLTINGDLTNSATGTVIIDSFSFAAATLIVNGDFLNNNFIDMRSNTNVTSTLTVNSGILTNNGEIQHSLFTTQFNSNAIINASLVNNGLLDINKGSALGTAFTLNNTGTFDTSNGIVDVESNKTFTVNCSGCVTSNAYRLGSGTTFVGTGTLDLKGDVTLNLVSDVTVAAGGLTLNFGNSGDNITIDSPTSATLINNADSTNRLELTGETVTSNVNIINNGELGVGIPVVSGTNNTTINGSIYNSATGSLTVSAGSFTGTLLDINNGAGIVNDGTITVAVASSGATLRVSGAGEITNNGTIQTGFNTLTTGRVIDAAITNNGLINSRRSLDITNTGKTLTMNDGSYLQVGTGYDLDINGGAVLWNGGTFTNTGSVDFNSGAVLNIGGSGTRILNGPTLNTNNANFSGGSLEVQSGTFNATGTTIVSAATSFTQTGGTFNVAGLTINSGGILNLTSGTINASGTTSVNTGGAMTFSGGILNMAGMLNNAGTVNLTTGNLSLANGGTHAGSFVTSSGTVLQFNGTGHTFNSGAGISGAGDVAFTGGNTYTFNSGSSYAISGDTGLNGSTSSLIFDINAVTNTFTHADGVLSGTGSLTTTGWTPTSGITADINSLVLGVGFSGSLIGDTVNGIGSITNQGSLTLDGATINPNFINTGTLFVVNAVSTLAGTATQSAGTLNINSGGDLTTANLNINGGILKGTGAVTGNVINNGGIIAPGTSPGTLNILGNYTQGAGGALNIELGGTSQGINYDWLNITGNAALDGVLNVSLFGGFTPTSGDLFDFMSYSGFPTGDFATVNVPAGFTNTPFTGFYQLGFTGLPVVATTPAATLNNTIDSIDEIVVLDDFQEQLGFAYIDIETDEEGEEKRDLACR